MSRLRLPALLAASLLPLAACHKAEVTSYEVPKEKDPDMPLASPDAGTGSNPSPDMSATAVPTASGADLSWTAPAAWKAKPLSAMRKGSYTVTGAGGEGDLSVTAFPGDVGGELANVNRWRGQVQLAPVDDSGLAGVVSHEQVNGLTLTVVDFGGQGPQRILGAIVPFGGSTWFFKLIGPDALVESAKPDFLKFLQTVSPNGAQAGQAQAAAPGDAGAMAGMAVPTPDGGAPLVWTAPASWQAKPLSAMRKGSYAVTGSDGSQADLSITVFPGAVGGELNNINRWRGQVQLPPVDDAGLPGVVDRRQVNGLAVTFVDFGGAGPQRILGAMIPVGGNTWFFKLMGPDALVEAAKPDFLQFLQSVRTGSP
jgi:hypothetical protein